jgi:hypothetical protein
MIQRRKVAVLAKTLPLASAFPRQSEKRYAKAKYALSDRNMGRSVDGQAGFDPLG